MALKFRRGTTAQQSGSLAFGEPFVNTTLGTLLVGGASGDIQLATIGTGSTGTFGAISGSGLDITGNANIAGNLTLGGNITIGDATTDNVVINADLSSSLIPNNDNAFDLGSTSFRYRNLYATTINGAIAATNGVVSGSSQILAGSTTNFATDVKTQLNSNTIVSGSSQVTLQSTTGFTAYNTALSTITGSLILSASVDRVSITNLNTFSGSQLTQNATLATLTGSNSTRLTNLETTTASLNTSVSNINSFTSSQLTQNSSLATITGSLILSASNLTQRVAANEAVSGTFARTNSANIFTGTQTITGSLYISQDLVVAGSSSIQNISSSNLVIGAAYVTLNTLNPSSRFAGLKIYDSGSNALTASIVWDSLNNKVLYQHPSGADTYNSAWLISGPMNSGALGSETGLTINKLTKAVDDDHIGDSQITDDGTVVSIAGALNVTGSVTASAFLGTIRATNGVVSGSSQVVGSSITTNTITIGSTSTALGGTSTTLAGLTSVSSTGFTGALTGNASTATTLQTARTINGTSFNGSADITIPNLVSGSSQILAGSTTNFATDVKTQLNSNTVISGSSQVTGISNAQLTNSSVTVTAGTGMSGGGAVSLGGTVTLTNAGVTSNVAGTGVSVSGATGAVTISIGQSVATTATPTFGNLTINGTITATGDITAYYTSDKRHKNNIQTISNAVLKVKQLNGVTWEWNDDVNKVTKATPKTGLIAQEVQQVLPQVVIEREDGFLALDYSKMVGLLVEAIKEQQIQIDQLKAQIGSK